MTSATSTILAICGSLRSTSSNMAILRAAARVAPPGMEVVLYEGLAALPHFSPDLDVEPLPEPVRDLRARVAAAAGLFISSPEYAHGMPGALKNALDWLVSALEALGKPVLLLSASPGGAAHAHAQFAEVLRTMNLPLVDGGAHQFTRARLDAAGDVADPALLAALSRGLADLAAQIGGPSS
jgi:chromate reductase, NAD(P)H dehydrogenase (quinone)